jgi:methylenetetrahydrofolate reductase (NADPH)
MRPVHPDFVTCTYGAGGSSREFSFAAWELLARMGFTPVVAHLTCVGASRADLESQIHRIHASGIRNIMALRGDPPRGESTFTPAPDGLAHAADLVALIKSLHPDICCGVAGYPETHPEAPALADDLRHLKEKLDAGADFVNTQLFFDNDAYFRFLDAARAAGIAAPILPGLMPVASPAQLDRALGFSRATAPEKLRKRPRRRPLAGSRPLRRHRLAHRPDRRTHRPWRPRHPPLYPQPGQNPPRPPPRRLPRPLAHHPPEL